MASNPNTPFHNSKEQSKLYINCVISLSIPVPFLVSLSYAIDIIKILPNVYGFYELGTRLHRGTSLCKIGIGPESVLGKILIR